MKTISILGCGWYGLPLGVALLEAGYLLKGSTTREQRLGVLQGAGVCPFLIDLSLPGFLIESDFLNCDVLVIAMPPKTTKTGADAYPDQLSALFKQLENSLIKDVILISSIGIYGDVNAIVNEETLPVSQTGAAKSLLTAEELAQRDTHFRTTIIRFGGLIGPNRNLATHFAGRMGIPNGRAPINLIHLSDCIGITKAIIEKEAFGFIYNAVAPTHPTRAEFYSRLCATSRLEPPQFIDELTGWKQVDSKNIPLQLRYQWKVTF